MKNFFNFFKRKVETKEVQLEHIEFKTKKKNTLNTDSFITRKPMVYGFGEPESKPMKTITEFKRPYGVILMFHTNSMILSPVLRAIGKSKLTGYEMYEFIGTDMRILQDLIKRSEYKCEEVL